MQSGFIEGKRKETFVFSLLPIICLQSAFSNVPNVFRVPPAGGACGGKGSTKGQQ